MADPKSTTNVPTVPRTDDASLRKATLDTQREREANIKIEVHPDNVDNSPKKVVGDPNQMIKVRVTHGTLTLGHRKDEAGNHLGRMEAKVGDVVSLPRGEVEHLLGRTLEGYPLETDQYSGKINVAKFPAPGPIKDTNIELVV